MNKILSLFVAFLLFVTISLGQQKTDIRTVETKVADLLMNLPTQNSKDLEAAMVTLTALGEPGIKNITSKLQPPGVGNDVAMRFAISGIAKYAGKGNDRLNKRMIALTLANALKMAKDDEVRDFLLQETQYVAGVEVVPIISKYVLHERLSDPAIRVLTRINTPLSNNALLYALRTAKGSQQRNIIEALGYTHYTPSVKKLQVLYPTLTDKNTKKVLLHSLASIADAQSITLLQKEAATNAYKSEATNAMASYLLYLNNISEGKINTNVANAANTLLQQPSLPIQFKSAALTLLYTSDGIKAKPAIENALKTGDNKYRATALGLLSKSYTSETSLLIQDLIKKSSDAGLQSDLIYTLGNNNDKNALPLLTSLLSAPDKQVQLAAIIAITKAGKQDAIMPLIHSLNKNDEVTNTAIQNALLTIEGDRVAKEAAEALPNATGNARNTLLAIIAQRGGAPYAAIFFKEAINNNDAARTAAIKGLPYVVRENDEASLATMLNNTANNEEIDFLQQALQASIKTKKSKAAQVIAVENLMKAAGNNAYKYYTVLAGISGKEALNLVQTHYKTGNQQQKEAAVNALSHWSDGTALPALYEISKNAAGNVKDTALKNFIAGINRSKNTTDQKVLMFRNAMELATTTDQKKDILADMAQNSSLLSLLFVSKYIDDAALQQVAIQSIITIVTDHPELYGPVVENITNKAIAFNKNGEAAYQKQALIKQFAAAPKDEGYVSLFNGKDLTGWKGLVGNPLTRAKMTPAQLATEQKKADEQMHQDWRVENGHLVFEGKGFNNLVSNKMYGNFEMIVDWKMEPKGDGGIYLRGSPQVQTWDTSRVASGAQVGSGGLYNNQKNVSKPLMVADNPINEWNTFRIKMIGDKVTVYLNGQLVTDKVTLENYWDRNIPIFDKEAIELQAHGTRLEFRDIYVHELPGATSYTVRDDEKKEGFVALFNGVNMDGWTGNTASYFAADGLMVCDPAVTPTAGSNKNVYTTKEYSDFIMRFEFQLTPGANNGLGIRTPLEGDAAYTGMELQILDNEAPIYKDLKPYQYHGSVYGVISALRGYLKPPGEWNYEEVTAKGNHITVKLNGTTILDGDIAKASKNNTETADHKPHPGLLNSSGHIGFLGHGAPLKFRNLRIKEISVQP